MTPREDDDGGRGARARGWIKPFTLVTRATEDATDDDGGRTEDDGRMANWGDSTREHDLKMRTLV